MREIIPSPAFHQHYILSAKNGPPGPNMWLMIHCIKMATFLNIVPVDISRSATPHGEHTVE